MRRALILHVGPHKTGTSYIQQRLAEDRDVLLERARIVYPRAGQEGLHGHHSLARVFRDAVDYMQQIRPLREELAAGDVGLLSSERLSRLDRAQLARIREHFPEFEIRAVAYLRVRSELLVSQWAESIRHGRIWSFPEFLDRALADPGASPIIDQRILLDALADVFGKASLDVMIYRPTADLYVEFLRTILGADAVIACSRGTRAWVNPSLPLHVTECLRMLHAMARARGAPDRRLVAARATQYLEDAAHREELERLRRLFEERAITIDVARVDRMFPHLDEALMNAYGDRVRNGGAFPSSKVTEVRCLADVDAHGSGELEALVTEVYERAVSDGR